MTESYQDLDAAETKSYLEKHPDTVVLDVRTAGEYKEGHLPRAINIDFYGVTFSQQIQKLDKTKTYLVYCQHGSRSSAAVSLLRAFNFPHIVHMACGFSG